MSRPPNDDAGQAPSAAGDQKRRPPSLVVGIGASAGGLAAFKSFFDNMPANTGIAFVLVQHLDPNHPSMLPELLQPHTAMPVAAALAENQEDCAVVIVLSGVGSDGSPA